ncbi:MAG: TatD family hydrolase [Bacteriovoracaceae bacterium]|jgi:TatD DNase family protein|nr:hydrolase TatD [Halobacteriovoraceae bacterium]MDP7319638.1 TatD family hydrolase [Bacteriovoracaceae bacterium]
MQYKIIETHCHLDYLKAKSLDEILNEAKEQGIEKIITIAVEPDNFDSVFNLAQKYPEVYFSQGIHPHDAKLSTSEALKTIEQRSAERKMVAVGEIGLDYHYDNSPRETQKKVFKQQLEIAIKTKKPVIIHSRDADEDMISILSEYAPKMPYKGVIHSFTSGEELAKKAIELGFYLGFNGIITFKNANNVRDIVSLCPIEKILIETDSPFLTPVPYRGKENAPKNLPYILEKIAEIKNLSPKEVEKNCYENSKKLFHF